MSNNVSAHMDESWNYSMWVEIFNASPSASYNLSDFYFTDDLAQPKKWKPSPMSVPPGGYSVLFFERPDRIGHASFKLTPEGGNLYMIDNTGNIIDLVIYPEQYRNISYGRIQDGNNEWVYFSSFSPGQSNNNKKWNINRCSNPIFDKEGGFYSGTLKIGFETPKEGETIYYSTDGSEPTLNSKKYIAGSQISINASTNIRACSYSDIKLPSNVVSSSYLFVGRNIDLPIASIVTEQKNLTDNTIGIYVKGTNGTIWRPGETELYNWFQDWDRPANFEFFDSNKTRQLNQELDIAISGGWTRGLKVKSLKIQPRKKFGDNRLRYNFFENTKPGLKLKDIQLRNSGNDFGQSMMRDAFMQSLIIGRMDMDYQAYYPAVCFINAEYKGILNLRERTSKDFLYSNYGLDEDEFFLFEQSETYTGPFSDLITFVQNNDVSRANVYNEIQKFVDLENFLNYFITQIYYANTDWPHNNLKIWKKKTDGKWRWILYDTDFGFGSGNISHNTLNLALTATDKLNNFERVPSSILFANLMNNISFRNSFIDQFCIQISSTFETNRVNHIMDSLAARIRNEFVYHSQKNGGNLDNNLNGMKSFSANRPTKMLEIISAKYCNSAPIQTIEITSNIQNATYKFNSEKIIDNKISLKSFKNRTVTIEPQNIVGYRFKHWLLESESKTNSIVSYGSTWKYWDNNGLPATNWFAENYDDNTWKQGQAQLGYGDKFPQLSTTIGYGSDTNNKYVTAYFRKEIILDNLETKNDFVLTTFVDDGACVYVNGQEVGRYNLPTGDLNFNTTALTYNNGAYANFSISKNILKEGNNIIAVEVHQDKANSSDLVFDLQLTYNSTSNNIIYENPKFTTTLTNNLNLKAVFETVEVIDPNEFADIKINEIVASNSVVQDEYGEYDDYIELYNNGNQDVNIAGWYLSDSYSNLELSPIVLEDSTKTHIPAKGRIIVWADEQPNQGPLHANFKLSKDGESVILSRKDPFGKLIIVDEITFPAIDKNMSYSRESDGSSTWVIQIPTFNSSNSEASAINEVEISPSIFPTLISTHFIVNNANNNTLRIIDVNGKVIIQKECESDCEIVHVESLQKGIYFIIIGNKSFKVVKTI
ncbi:hypothetical protein MASR2M117_11600 [Paludibacter sp.]